MKTLKINGSKESSSSIHSYIRLSIKVIIWIQIWSSSTSKKRTSMGLNSYSSIFFAKMVVQSSSNKLIKPSKSLVKLWCTTIVKGWPVSILLSLSTNSVLLDQKTFSKMKWRNALNRPKTILSELCKVQTSIKNVKLTFLLPSTQLPAFNYPLSNSILP